jgi:hypothetical protein
MTTSSQRKRGASLEVLRAEARDELDTVIMERCRQGQDPWDFMSDLPTVDELVVWMLRAERIEQDNGVQLTASRDYRVLRQIALEHPDLTKTVWTMIGRFAA